MHDIQRDAPPPARPPFAEVYATCAPRVYRFCLSLLRDPVCAEDVANDVFVSALAAYDRGPSDPERIVTWLFSIARNAAIDDIRKRARWRRLFDRIGPEAVARERSDPGHTLDLRADVQRVLDAIATLRPAERELIAMRIGAEMSHARMAEILGKNEHAVAMATRRALERLRERLGENG